MPCCDATKIINALECENNSSLRVEVETCFSFRHRLCYWKISMISLILSGFCCSSSLVQFIFRVLYDELAVEVAKHEQQNNILKLVRNKHAHTPADASCLVLDLSLEAHKRTLNLIHQKDNDEFKAASFRQCTTKRWFIHRIPTLNWIVWSCYFVVCCVERP